MATVGEEEGVEEGLGAVIVGVPPIAPRERMRETRGDT
jgi:hypothetical protein